MQVEKHYIIINSQHGIMLEEAKATQETLNRREVYKNQKLLQINQIYYCQCGKNYLTFSALYLHVRNKHDVKLTTKRNSSNCKVENKESKTIITYFITPQKIETLESQPDYPSSQQNQKLDNNHIALQQMLAIIDQYVLQQCRVTEHQKTAISLFQELKHYLTKVSDLNQEEYQLEIQNIALYFNEFIVYALPISLITGKIRPQVIHQAETNIIKFWRWLRQKNYTSSQLMQRSYPTPPFIS